VDVLQHSHTKRIKTLDTFSVSTDTSQQVKQFLVSSSDDQSFRVTLIAADGKLISSDVAVRSLAHVASCLSYPTDLAVAPDGSFLM
jgi:hypothetical protein